VALQMLVVPTLERDERDGADVIEDGPATRSPETVPASAVLERTPPAARLPIHRQPPVIGESHSPVGDEFQVVPRQPRFVQQLVEASSISHEGCIGMCATQLQTCEEDHPRSRTST
jgi:hypothetical protein